MNLAGFKEFELTLFVFSGILDGEVGCSLLVTFLDVFSWLGLFEFRVFFDGEMVAFCSFDGGDLAASLERFLGVKCEVFSGFVGVPCIGESLLGVLVTCRRAARLLVLLLFP